MYQNTISGDGSKSWISREYTVTKQGYRPIGVVGWSIGVVGYTVFDVRIRFPYTNNAVLELAIYSNNIIATTANISFSVYILWEKV